MTERKHMSSEEKDINISSDNKLETNYETMKMMKSNK